MANSMIGSSSPSSRPQQPKQKKVTSLATRRFVAWTVEIIIFIASGVVPFTLGAYINSRTQLQRVPLNPVLVVTEKAIARPLALPISYGVRNVAWPTNILWSLALILPTSFSAWQMYLLAKTGSTIPKRWFGIRVVNAEGKAPDLGAVLVREGLGRWTIPLTVAYFLWRYSFVFPNLALFTSLTILMILAESLGWPAQKPRRALHDQLAGTKTIDIRSVSSFQEQSTINETDVNSTSTAPTPTENYSRNNPNFSLFVVGITSMIAVLSTLVGTQIYIQTQETQRRSEQINSQKYLELIKALNPNNGASNQDRERAILAVGSIDDQQAIKLLVDLLVKETDPKTLDTVQQALTNSGLKAIPELNRMNQFLAKELESMGRSQNWEFRQNQLIITQLVINKIISIYGGKVNGIDLGNAQLGSQILGNNSLFKLVLKNVDLSGIVLKSANLYQADFRGSRFRGVGEDGRWDTYDDVVADLTNANLKQTNLAATNLSRILMNHADLSQASLNKANLSYTRLLNANLSSSQLVGADLRNAVLENASLTNADLSDADLTEASLYAAHLVRVSAIGTQLAYANLIKTDWQGADLSETYLDYANLSNANLSAARLTGASLRSVNLENANLRNTDLSRADLRGANVSGADFQGAVLFVSKQNPADQFVETPDIGSQNASIQGVDFSKAKNLDQQQLAFICTQGGLHSRCP